MMMLQNAETTSFSGPQSYALADWRLRISDLYSQIRAIEDPKQAWKLWHSVRTDLFWNHAMSPVPEKLLEHFEEIEVFGYDPEMRFLVDLSDMPLVTEEYNLGGDGNVELKRIARTNGLKEKLCNELDVFWISGYGGGLFIPFKDKSSGQETYGGGRYLVDAIKSADLGLAKDGRLILDFNFAYNPSCAISQDYVCPLAPSQNHLPVKILAGEKLQSWVK
ncbi:MAG: DUF1684 domain-containing protein [Pseudomonadota bacterium]